MTTALEPIANVVADLRAGRVVNAIGNIRGAFGLTGGVGQASVFENSLVTAQRPQPVVDATPFYHDLLARRQVDVYGDFPCIVSPWDSAMICYQNEHGNVLVLQTTRRPWSAATWRLTPDVPRGSAWRTHNRVDWDRVKWIQETLVWAGWKSTSAVGVGPTGGPLHCFQAALYPDGDAADLHFVKLLPKTHPHFHDGEDPNPAFEMPQLTLMAALNFLNCKNVAIEEPQQTGRAQRRRLERLGVSVQHIVVRPIGKRHRSAAAGAVPLDGPVPLTHVRGHFAHYGPKYGKGLMFGKYEGRYWIPQFAYGRGEGDDEAAPTYELRPAMTAATTR